MNIQEVYLKIPLKTTVHDFFIVWSGNYSFQEPKENNFQTGQRGVLSLLPCIPILEVHVIYPIVTI